MKIRTRTRKQIELDGRNSFGYVGSNDDVKRNEQAYANIDGCLHESKLDNSRRIFSNRKFKWTTATKLDY